MLDVCFYAGGPQPQSDRIIFFLHVRNQRLSVLRKEIHVTNLYLV